MGQPIARDWWVRWGMIHNSKRGGWNDFEDSPHPKGLMGSLHDKWLIDIMGKQTWPDFAEKLYTVQDKIYTVQDRRAAWERYVVMLSESSIIMTQLEDTKEVKNLQVGEMIGGYGCSGGLGILGAWGNGGMGPTTPHPIWPWLPKHGQTTLMLPFILVPLPPTLSPCPCPKYPGITCREYW
jgi:hypothetical protein